MLMGNVKVLGLAIDTTVEGMVDMFDTSFSWPAWIFARLGGLG